MEKVREALKRANAQWINEETQLLYRDALAEVEQWEARLHAAGLTIDGLIEQRGAAEADRDDADLSAQISRDATEIWKARLAEAERRADWLYRDAEEKHGQIKAAEAERDRLAEALRRIVELNKMGLPARALDDIARAALAADEAKP
jgi:multidrug resistance efflux pump